MNAGTSATCSTTSMLSTTSKRAALVNHFRGRAQAVIDWQLVLAGMQRGDSDVFLDDVDAGYVGAELCHGLGQDAAAAADVENAQTAQRLLWRGSRAKCSQSLSRM